MTQPGFRASRVAPFVVFIKDAAIQEAGRLLRREAPCGSCGDPLAPLQQTRKQNRERRFDAQGPKSQRDRLHPSVLELIYFEIDEPALRPDGYH